MDNRPYRRRSLFWPMLLIGVGAFWLLINLGLISTANLGLLLSLWPVLLIALGLDILFGRRFPLIGALIGLGTVALAMALVMWGSRLGLDRWVPGWGTVAAPRTETFSEPVGPATSARLRLELASGQTTVTALGDSSDLIHATLTHTGRIDFTATGTTEKSVRLRQVAQYFGPHFWITFQPEPWDIGLTSRVPLDLNLTGGSGSADLNLSQLQLTALTVDGGSGEVTLKLPAGSQRYPAHLQGGSGELSLNIPAEARVDLDLRAASGHAALVIGQGAEVALRLNSGSGLVEIALPAEAAAHVEVQATGSGALHLPSALKLVSGREGHAGVWESAGFAQAAHPITIVIAEAGSGAIDIH